MGLISHVHLEMVPFKTRERRAFKKKEKKWKPIGLTFCLSHSKRPSQIYALSGQTGGNSDMVPMGARGATRRMSLSCGEAQHPVVFN